MRVAGKIHCHPDSRPAFGYLRARAVGSSLEVGLVLFAHALDLGDQRGPDRGGQHRHPILAPLAVADDDLVRREVDVLHSQAAAFQQAKSRTVEQDGHEAGHAVEPLEDGRTSSRVSTTGKR